MELKGEVLSSMEHVLPLLKSEDYMKNEVIAITGASAGVGRAVSRLLAKHGASIGLIARGEEGLNANKEKSSRLAVKLS